MMIRWMVILIAIVSSLILQGCSVKNLSHLDPYKKELGKKYDLKQSLFITTKGGSIYSLMLPRQSNWVPATIDEYRLSPNEWWAQPEWQKSFGGRCTPEQAKAWAYQIVGVVEAGTVIEVTKLTAQRMGIMDWLYEPIVRIHDPQFADLEILACFLLAMCEDYPGTIYRPFDVEYLSPIEDSQ